MQHLSTQLNLVNQGLDQFGIDHAILACAVHHKLLQSVVLLYKQNVWVNDLDSV
jgi:hypothetical protein